MMRMTLPLPRIDRVHVWSIGIYTGKSPFALRPPAGVVNPVLTAQHVSDVRARYVADPFMLRHESSWYMFFEVLDEDSRRGKIAYARSDDGLHWVYGGVVIDEPFHLSYPYIVTWHDEVYLVPESGAAKAVRLYRARQFPTRWVLVCDLLVGEPYADPSLVYHHARWWMFVVSDPRRNDSLRLYCAEHLGGDWTEHPQSPVVVSNPHWARPGGRVFECGGRLYRYAQDDSPKYGRQVWALEITELTTTHYEECLVQDQPVVRGTGWGWHALGMHHVDVHPRGDGRWIACVDGHRNVRRFRFTRRP
jgi:hypothetical protein